MRDLAFLILRLAGAPLILREVFRGKKVTILCYHDPVPQVFERHLLALKKRYNIISLKGYVDSRKGRTTKKLPPKALVITVDDGFAGNYQLREVIPGCGVPITVFLCSSIVATKRRYWWTTIENPRDAGEFEKLPDDERLRLLRSRGFEELREYDPRQSLSTAEIRELSTICDLQSHTKLHPVLPRCSTARASQEIVGSKVELEQKFGLTVYALAYPHGKYGDREVEIAKVAGYDCAVTTQSGVNDSTTDLFRLHRICINDSADANEVIVKASGFWHALHKLIPKRRTYA